MSTPDPTPGQSDVCVCGHDVTDHGLDPSQCVVGDPDVPWDCDCSEFRPAPSPGTATPAPLPWCNLSICPEGDGDHRITTGRCIVAPDLSPDAPDALRETLLRELCEQINLWDQDAVILDEDGLAEHWLLPVIDRYVTALAVLRDDTTTALARVEALADRWESEADRADAAEPLNTDGLIRMILAAKHCREHARELRAALDQSVTFSTWATVKRLRAELTGEPAPCTATHTVQDFWQGLVGDVTYHCVRLGPHEVHSDSHEREW